MAERDLENILESIESDVSSIYSNTNEISGIQTGMEHLNIKMDKVIKLLERITKASEATQTATEYLASQ